MKKIERELKSRFFCTKTNFKFVRLWIFELKLKSLEKYFCYLLPNKNF